MLISNKILLVDILYRLVHATHKATGWKIITRKLSKPA